jgi:hypothetical protein
MSYGSLPFTGLSTPIYLAVGLASILVGLVMRALGHQR